MDERKRHPVPTGLITKREKAAGWLYLPVHIVVFPLVFGLVAPRLSLSLTNAEANLIYLGVGFLYCLLFLRGFLQRGFDAMVDRPTRFLLAIANAIAIYWVLAILTSILWGVMAEQLGLDAALSAAGNPNEAALNSFVGQDAQIIKALAICFAPVVEEVLFRGVVFGEIRKRSRILAYLGSVLLFGVFHIWQYVLAYRDPMLLIYVVQYIPHSLALAWSYERSNSIWAPIACHAAMNLLAFSIV